VIGGGDRLEEMVVIFDVVVTIDRKEWVRLDRE
jgi:hypothetical protein